jgi:hypothetical protein
MAHSGDKIATRAKRDRIEVGMKSTDLRPVLVILGVLTFCASAGQSSLAQTAFSPVDAFAGLNNVEANTDSENPDDQAPQVGVTRAVSAVGAVFRCSIGLSSVSKPL